VPAVRNWPTSTLRTPSSPSNGARTSFCEMIAWVLAMPALAWSIRRLRLIDGGLRSELTRGQLLGAIERQLRHRGLRLEACEIALLGGIEQLHQRRARLHAGPAVNMISVMRPLTSEVTLT
jgi:hypothetical protein